MTRSRAASDRGPISGEVVGQSRAERFRAVERRIAVVSRMLDDLVEIPGTGRRVGLDPIIGLIPVVGDSVSAIVGFWIIGEAARFRLPRIVLARMVLNTVVDLAIGMIPLVGDLFDFVSKSNTRNLELFRRHATDPLAGTGDQRQFFLGLGLVALGLMWLVAIAIGWLLDLLSRTQIPVPG
ncbi:MAG: DUF4112 domain-containing protein [Chloroflexota bacterium]